ncbi:hypothetical protein NLX71_08010 [Paenibacillus sp. MZ04-78.2]|uniref:hypothetical protein n=1 Tax=Paenibacillus sp. MZ04-78.2 TaxID=2962034 RepID=UPI0020B6B97D|nr:hypothetical protein [Paenibacillus sp. MZ04-78.2]MCP3773261.1 hypothetical protein [Paenibacillus sp. MZ04-78.2]
MATEKKQLQLNPDAFTVNENGEVVINNAELAKAIMQTTETNQVGEQGVQVSVSVSF